MATSGRSAGGAEDKPTFTFEQIVLRFVVGVLVIALFVMIVEFGRVRGQVGELETAGAPAPAAATQDPLGSPQTFKVVLKEMAVVPDAVEVPAGTPVTLNVVNEGEIPHNLAISGGPKTPDLKTGGTAIYMYHCGTAPTLHHIGNGMYGAIITDPPGLPKVDHEYLLVQSELYLGPQGQPGSLRKMQNESLDAVVFNGYATQYKFRPIRVEPGQRVRVWVLDAGPSENSAFHIVGTVFDTTYKEGEYLLRPGASRGGAGVLDLQPAQGGFVEFTFDEPGLYPIVTHKFANVAKGALGLFQAGDVKASGGGH
jgi:plastocyanin